MESIRLLIADGDSNMRSAIIKKAIAEGFLCDDASDGIAALKLFRRHDYSLIIMDTQLPELDGKNVCRQIRKTSDIPILIVSALNREEDRLAVFDLGADDYVTKPFSMPELMARIRVFLHRSSELQRLQTRRITFSGLSIDTVSHTVEVDEKTVPMPPKEYELLYFLSQNPEKAFSREMLLNEVWGYDFTGSDRTVDTHIKALREYIRPYDRLIVTVWGFGYKFNVDS